jgi:hypothetical protein
MRRSHLHLCSVALALTAGLALASPALAAQDELSGGTVALELTSSKALAFKPSSLSLPITSGAVDPVSGDGTVKAAGTVQVKVGKRKAELKISTFTFGANGGPGTIGAKAGKKRVNGFGDLIGGTVARDGFGAQISGVAASLSADGAKALNSALKAKKKKGKSTATARQTRKIKAGQPLGSVSATTIPKTVEVLPGGSMTLHTEPSLLSTFMAHCVNALPGMGGVYPIAPATQDPVSAAFTFPVTGGAVAPSLAEGKVVTGGGQGLAKNMSGGIPYPCDGDPPVGTAVLQSQLAADFSGHLVGVAQLPNATQNASIAVIDFSTGTKSFDPATKQITVTGAKVTLDRLSATLLNQIFPNRSGDPANDFSDKIVLGTLDITATLR